MVRRDARVNSLIMGTKRVYLSPKCDFNAELAIPRPLYCGAERRWRNSFRRGLDSSPSASVVRVAVATELTAMPTTGGEMAVRLRLVTAVDIAMDGGRFGGMM